MNRLPKILRRRAHALGLATERRELPPYTREPITYRGMPVVGWGPEPQPVVDAPPACKCSHAQVQHTDGEGQCWIVVCGCRAYRPAVTA